MRAAVRPPRESSRDRNRRARGNLRSRRSIAGRRSGLNRSSRYPLAASPAEIRQLMHTPGIDQASMADDDTRRRVKAKRLGDVWMIEYDKIGCTASFKSIPYQVH